MFYTIMGFAQSQNCVTEEIVVVDMCKVAIHGM